MFPWSYKCPKHSQCEVKACLIERAVWNENSRKCASMACAMILPKTSSVCFHILLWSTRHSPPRGLMEDLTQSSDLCHSWPRLNYVCEIYLCVLLLIPREGVWDSVFLCLSETQQERGYDIWACVRVCAQRLTVVMYDLMPLHATLTESRGRSVL